ncbi:MAG: diguanylate cyclase [Rhodoferax sp.]|uniref:GGDEF domain-containing protein n=1 Tax=Rhodoferax sp. TaxID=50421 RepID=UPI002736C1B3|nr:diguanylate cyclase [Rhodoferax sp.]MDP2678560.1 diguanylate cyclase [Rhodoferax sp.]
MNFSTGKKLFLSHFLAIVLVSGSIGSYFYQNAIDNLLGSLQARLKYSAALLSTTVDPSQLDQIVSPADKALDSYKKGVAHLRELVASNPDIAFIYVMRRDGEAIRFVLDSDPDSPGEPGEVYAVPVPALLEGFSKAGSDRELFTDKWGTFMSGFAPLSGGGGRYVIGIDMRADEVANKLNALRTTGALSLVFSLLLAFLFSHFLSRSLVKRIHALHRRCLEVDTSADMVSGQKGDELDQLAVTFGDMLTRLQQSQTDLEQRVEQRTTQLSLANQQLKAEINQREKIAQLLEETARTDFLTKLINRRAMHRFLQNEMARFERTGGTFSLVLVDIDHFKNINDQFGHDIGDDVLVALSRAFERSAREQDIVSRWGGEEFLILLPNTAQVDAFEQAERLRQLLDSDALQIERYPHRVTASFGVCEFAPGDSLESLLKQTDVALYQAKVRGRNQVCANVRVVL